MNYTLRQATEADEPFLFQVLKRSMGEYVDAIWGWDEEWQRNSFREKFDPARRQVIVSDAGDVGALGVEQRFGHFFLAHVSLLPRFQGRGLGSRVIGDVIATADQQGLPVRLSVLRPNVPAARLYERLGFQTIGEEKVRFYMELRAGHDPAAPLPYRQGVGAIVTRDDGLVLGCEKTAAPGLWQFPQGGIDGDEEPDDALRRELREEIGTDRFRIIKRAGSKTGYEFPAAVRRAKGRRGQEHVWYQVEFEKSAGPELHRGDGELGDWQWMTARDLVRQVIDWKKLAYREACRLLDLPCQIPDELVSVRKLPIRSARA